MPIIIVASFTGGPRDGEVSKPKPVDQMKAVYRERGGRYVYVKTVHGSHWPSDPVDRVLSPGEFARCIYAWEANA